MKKIFNKLAVVMLFSLLLTSFSFATGDSNSSAKNSVNFKALDISVLVEQGVEALKTRILEVFELATNKEQIKYEKKVERKFTKELFVYSVAKGDKGAPKKEKVYKISGEIKGDKNGKFFEFAKSHLNVEPSGAKVYRFGDERMYTGPSNDSNCNLREFYCGCEMEEGVFTVWLDTPTGKKNVETYRYVQPVSEMYAWSKDVNIEY